MQAVQRIEREKRMDGGKKEEVDDPHTSAAKQKRPLRNGAELLPAERPSCSCVAACIRHYFPRQGRRLEPRWRASREFHPSEVLSKLHTGVSLYLIRTACPGLEPCFFIVVQVRPLRSKQEITTEKRRDCCIAVSPLSTWMAVQKL